MVNVQGGVDDLDAERERIVSVISGSLEHDLIEGHYDTSLRSKLLFISSMAALSVIAFVCSLAIGSVDIPFGDTLSVIGHHLFPAWISLPEAGWYDTIIMRERLPRTLLCLLTGVALASAGTVMQGLLRNPLVSPFTLGVSTAASFGAAIAIVFGSSLFGSAFYGTFDFLGFKMTVENIVLVIMSFVFGMLSILLVLRIAKKDASRSTLVLSGVVISYLFQAGISFSKYVSDDEALREITNWLMGGMWNATWGAIVILTPIVIPCVIYLEKLALDINSLSAGDEIAKNVGVDVGKLRNRGLIVSTLVASSCVAFAGVIGFIGLMAPHMCRMVMGNDTRYVLPASALLGAAILLFSDIVARTIVRPDQIPVGIILYLVGGAFFIWMVTRRKWRGKL
ncbi:FecCD family ABC transporter permease [Methanomassiliicoccus luminyensis]|uniref:FecCD family ABC transporter permease n=1 Tax=Methanomassiliicoccus luminyensis TaxID=1080712 RepID=UPI000362DDF5|nr:iron ABC transporter permease [Methanomassiliicoccus luminyensis]